MDAPKVTPEERVFAQEYLNASKIVSLIESTLNEACLSKPRDLYGYVSTELWRGCRAATIDQWTAVEVVGDDGSPAVQVAVSAHFRGTCTVRGRAVAPMDHPLPVTTTKVEGETLDSIACHDLSAFCTALTKLTADSKVEEHGTVDGVLMGMAIDESIALPAATGLRLAASLAAWNASADVRGVPVHAIVAKVVGVSEPTVPTPMMTAVAPAASHGKCLMRGVWVGPPVGVTGDEGVRYLVLFNQALQAVASRKAASEGHSQPIGGLTPSKIDKLEDALQLIREASVSISKAHPPQIIVDVGVGADSLKKGKYELEKKVAKSAEDLVKEFTSLAHNRPEIIGFVDPLLYTAHKPQLDAFAAALKEMGKFVFINDVAPSEDTGADDGQEEASATKDAEATPAETQLEINPLVGAVVCSGTSATVSEMALHAMHATTAQRPLCYSAVHSDRLWLDNAADFATGCGARFLHVGQVSGAGATALNRLHGIAAEVATLTPP
eukprot:m.199634 g.199634  ORF g.199634 m.199634 type:complete len:496 (+) comp20799_c0_seq1:36-1523(+)